VYVAASVDSHRLTRLDQYAQRFSEKGLTVTQSLLFFFRLQPQNNCQYSLCLCKQSWMVG